jgi:hypothetical protein
MRWWLGWVVAGAAVGGPATEGLLARYAAEGASAPDAARGRALWESEHPAPDGGAARSCVTCHGPRLGDPGRHATTGEVIEPMTAPGRLTDAAKIEKWFGRNCRWTLQRDCSPGEKADLVAFLTGGAR